MNVALKPIQPKRISDQVFEQIRELIFRGELPPGDQLMPERELAEALNVSRTTVRSAISKLVAIGLLEHRQGHGTFVRPPETWRKRNPLAAALNQETSLIDLMEVRLGLECHAATLAAQRCEQGDIQYLSKSLKEMENQINSGHLGVSADTSFHMAIAFATKNPFHVYIMKNFYDLLFVGIKKNLTMLYEERENHVAILVQHQKIFDAIKAHNPKSASTAMEKHINFVIDFFRRRGNTQPIETNH